MQTGFETNTDMSFWRRDDTVDRAHYFEHEVRLEPNQWCTFREDSNGERKRFPGMDEGGYVYLNQDIADRVRSTNGFTAFAVCRRSLVSFFMPQIIAEGDWLPNEEFEALKQKRGMKLGKDYDIFISFPTNEQAVLFGLSCKGVNNVKYE